MINYHFDTRTVKSQTLKTLNKGRAFTRDTGAATAVYIKLDERVSTLPRLTDAISVDELGNVSDGIFVATLTGEMIILPADTTIYPVDVNATIQFQYED